MYSFHRNPIFTKTFSNRTVAKNEQIEQKK